MTKTVFIIPCYNESDRINITEYSSSLSNNSELILHFVNYGSSDNTVETLEKIKDKFPDRVLIYSLTKNQGKAEAVRYAINQSLNQDEKIKFIGYLDADLATSLTEGYHLAKTLHENKELDLVFGSRVLLVGSNISRNKHRHFIGRVIATIISNILRLKVYDTQCGSKVFSREFAILAFDKSFISKWLFDVEIFARCLTNSDLFGEKSMLEIPLKSWIDKDGSKVKTSYIFKLFFDLRKIYKAYPELKTRSNT